MLLACVIVVFLLALFFFYGYRDHRDLHSFPTRRSSDLADSRVRSCEELSESLARFALINSQIDPHVMLARFRRRERSEEHTSELQSRVDLVCRLLLEKKKQHTNARR